MPVIHMAAPLLYEQLKRHLPKGIDRRLELASNFKPLPGFVADYLEAFLRQQPERPPTSRGLV